MKYLMCNLKSNKTLKEILEYKNNLKNIETNNLELVLFPSSIYLGFFYDAPYKIGSQNISSLHSGSYTGEILAHQLKSLRVSYCLINHSDANEKLYEVISKIKNATKENIKVVLCIGEIEKQSPEETIIEIKKELNDILSKLNNQELNNLILAYEPVWAINNNVTLDSDNISEIISKLKKELKKIYNLIPSVIYGGSINLENINNLIECNNIDGFLIGNCANDSKNIIEIIAKF